MTDMDQSPDEEPISLEDVIEHMTPAGKAEFENAVTRMLLTKEREKNAVLTQQLAELRDHPPETVPKKVDPSNE